MSKISEKINETEQQLRELNDKGMQMRQAMDQMQQQLQQMDHQHTALQSRLAALREVEALGADGFLDATPGTEDTASPAASDAEAPAPATGTPDAADDASQTPEA